jgi:ABC-type transporter Mla MlaB component
MERQSSVNQVKWMNERGVSMWKVQRTDNGGLVVLLVSGRIEGEHLTELCKAFNAETKNQTFILDMSEVRLVDQDSIEFLSRCEANGIELRNCPAYIREWIERDRQMESSAESRRGAKAAVPSVPLAARWSR